MKNRITIAKTVAVALLVTVGLSACNKPADDATPATSAPATATSDDTRTIRVQTTTLQPEEFTETVTVTGSIDALDDAVLSARSAGTVVSLVALGRTVQAGATIAAIDAGLAQAGVQQAQASVNAAKAQHALAEDTFKRQQPLYRDSVISPIEFEQVRSQLSQAEAQVEAAEATLKQLQEQLAYTKVTAPFSGTVEAHRVEIGEQVAPGTPVARLVNVRRVKVVAGIPERYAGNIRQGARALVRLDSYGLPPVEGKVTFVGSAINADSRTFPVEIDLDNRDGALKPEMIATLEVTRRTIENAIVVKQSAVLRDELGNSVYIVDRSSGKPVAQRKTITIGSSNSGKVVVTEGLEPGVELIVVGQSNVAPGDLLEIESGTNAKASL